MFITIIITITIIIIIISISFNIIIIIFIIIIIIIYIIIIIIITIIIIGLTHSKTILENTVEIERISCILRLLISTTTNLLHVHYVNITSYVSLEKKRYHYKETQ